MATSISRRQFLKASGLAAASACAAGLLSSCGGSSSAGSTGGSASGSVDTTKYTILYSSQPATLNYLTTATDLEMVVGANCVDTLVEYDNKGVMREGLATSWDWDADTLTWTFHLREENWVDNNGEVVAPVTAQDFVDALKYVLTPDYASSNVGLVTAYVAGAEDYYNYYVYLNNANTGVVDDDGTTYTADASGVVTVTSSDGTAETYSPVDFDTVGIKAVDDHTLTYTLTYDFPGFLSLLCYLPYAPAYGPLQRNIYNNEDINHYDYDPEKSRKILENAGCKMEDDGFYHRNGEKVSFVISESSGDQVRIDIAQIAAQQLSSVGIDVTVDIPTQVDWDGQMAYLIGWGSPFDADDHTYKVFGTGKGANFSGYSNRPIH